MRKQTQTPAKEETSIDDDLANVVSEIEKAVENLEAVRTRIEEEEAEADDEDDRDSRLEKADEVFDILIRMDQTKKWDFVEIMDAVREYKGLP